MADGVAQNRKQAAREVTTKFFLSEELQKAFANGNTEKCVRINNPIATELGYDVSGTFIERQSDSIDADSEEKRIGQAQIERSGELQRDKDRRKDRGRDRETEMIQRKRQTEMVTRLRDTEMFISHAGTFFFIKGSASDWPRHLNDRHDCAAKGQFIRRFEERDTRKGSNVQTDPQRQQ